MEKNKPFHRFHNCLFYSMYEKHIFRKHMYYYGKGKITKVITFFYLYIVARSVTSIDNFSVVSHYNFHHKVHYFVYVLLR